MSMHFGQVLAQPHKSPYSIRLAMPPKSKSKQPAAAAAAPQVWIAASSSMRSGICCGVAAAALRVQLNRAQSTSPPAPAPDASEPAAAKFATLIGEYIAKKLRNLNKRRVRAHCTARPSHAALQAKITKNEEDKAAGKVLLPEQEVGGVRMNYPRWPASFYFIASRRVMWRQETLAKKAETDLLIHEFDELSKLYAPVEDEVAPHGMQLPLTTAAAGTAHARGAADPGAAALQQRRGRAEHRAHTAGQGADE